jgi:hypothetical protein
MVCELKASETVLTGVLEDKSAVFGVLAQIEALGLELLELRRVRARPKSRESVKTSHLGLGQPGAVPELGAERTSRRPG